MTVDPGTFGNSKAAEALAQITTPGIGSAIHWCTWYMNQIANSSMDSQAKKYLLLMIRNKAISNVDRKPWPDNVKSLVRNVLCVHYRTKLKSVV